MVAKTRQQSTGRFIGVVREFDVADLWRLSNLISLSRVVLIVPVCFLLLRDAPGDSRIALLLMVIATATDFFDGYFARRLNQVTLLGKVLDPLADKICLLAVAFCLSLPVRAFRLPLPFLLVVLLKDIFIVVLGYWAYREKKALMVSNWLGKWTSGALAWLMILITLNVPVQPWYLFFFDSDIVLWIALALIAATSMSYLIRFLDIASGARAQNK